MSVSGVARIYKFNISRYIDDLTELWNNYDVKESALPIKNWNSNNKVGPYKGEWFS
jgi:hypothetical protein